MNKHSRKTTLLIVLLMAVAVGCGGDRDDREDVRKANGEPDDIQFTEGPFADYEVWTYYNYKGSGKDYEFQFQRNRNSCGASDNWIIVTEREITPEQGASLSRPGQIPLKDRSSNPIKP